MAPLHHPLPLPLCCRPAFYCCRHCANHCHRCYRCSCHRTFHRCCHCRRHVAAVPSIAAVAVMLSLRHCCCRRAFHCRCCCCRHAIHCDCCCFAIVLSIAAAITLPLCFPSPMLLLPSIAVTVMLPSRHPSPPSLVDCYLFTPLADGGVWGHLVLSCLLSAVFLLFAAFSSSFLFAGWLSC